MEKSNLQVLIIDNAPEIAGRVLTMLQDNHAYHIEGTIISSETAFQYIKDYSPGIIILDIDCPPKLWLKLLLQNRLTQNLIPIIVLTNRSDPYYRNFCQVLGVKYFLDKTTEFEKLPEIVYSLHNN